MARQRRGGSSRRRGRTSQPRIYREVTRLEDQRKYVASRYEPIFLGNGKVHPNCDSSELAETSGDTWVSFAGQFQDMSQATNRAIWRGDLASTALALMLQSWCNSLGNQQKRSPNFYVLDVDAMQKQLMWAMR